jgi:chromosome segregation ATPase
MDPATEVKELTRRLAEQVEAKELAYFDLADRNRRVDELEIELGEVQVQLAQECGRSTALDLEVTLYRDRYHQALARLARAGCAITIANAARDYLAAIERRDSLDDIANRLERLREEIGLSLDSDPNPMHEMICGLEAELETLRRRSAELRDECAVSHARADEAEGRAADWQELAETSDRHVVALQKELRRMESPSAD